METQRPKMAKQLCKRVKMKNFTQMSKLIIKLKKSRQCGTGIKVDQINERKSNLKIDPPICGQLIFDKDSKLLQRRKTFFLNKYYLKNWISIVKKTFNTCCVP